MRLTTKGRYAVTAMVELALNQGKGRISLAEIAERHGISQSYLEQLFAALRRKGLVDGTRGPGGGGAAGRTAATSITTQVCHWPALGSTGGALGAGIQPVNKRHNTMKQRGINFICLLLRVW